MGVIALQTMNLRIQDPNPALAALELWPFCLVPEELKSERLGTLTP